MELETVVLAGFTVLAAGQDLRKKQVDVNLYWIFGIIAGAALIFRMWEDQNMMWEKDGLSYTMVTSADKTLEEMAELAKAYMDSER